MAYLHPGIPPEQHRRRWSWALFTQPARNQYERLRDSSKGQQPPSQLIHYLAPFFVPLRPHEPTGPPTWGIVRYPIQGRETNTETDTERPKEAPHAHWGEMQPAIEIRTSVPRSARQHPTGRSCTNPPAEPIHFNFFPCSSEFQARQPWREQMLLRLPFLFDNRLIGPRRRGRTRLRAPPIFSNPSCEQPDGDSQT